MKGGRRCKGVSGSYEEVVAAVKNTAESKSSRYYEPFMKVKERPNRNYDNS